MRAVLVFPDRIERVNLDQAPEALLTITWDGENRHFALDGVPISDIRTDEMDAIYVEVGQDASEWRPRLSAWARGDGNDSDFR